MFFFKKFIENHNSFTELRIRAKQLELCSSESKKKKKCYSILLNKKFKGYKINYFEPYNSIVNNNKFSSNGRKLLFIPYSSRVTEP